MKKINPIHPGEILLEEFLTPMHLSQNKIANDMGVPPRRINEIVHGKRKITADTALRLAHYFEMSPHSGLVCKWIMTLMSKRTNLLAVCLPK